jgi:hypothetical protein
MELGSPHRNPYAELMRPSVQAFPSNRDERALRDALRDALWEHSRNSLGTARLLHQEGRPEELVATACLMAVETACRAALTQTGLVFDGNLELSLRRLKAPSDMWELQESGRASQRLAAAERAVAWVAGYLRREAPDRSWGS